MSNEPNNKDGALGYLKDTGLNSFLSILACAGLNGLVLYVSPSPTMRNFIGVGAVIGALLGYALTLAAFKSVAKKKRVGLCIASCALAIVFFVQLMFINWVLDPDVARTYAWAEAIRDQLVGPSTWANTVMFLTSGAASLFLVSAFALLSPVLDRINKPAAKKS